MPNSDDERLAYSLRAIRRRLALRQVDLARMADVPYRNVILVEAGRAGDVPLDRTRRMFAAVGGRAKLVAWWRGAAADRLVDERHAMLVERVVSAFLARGWQAAVEVTYSEYGERGSIDVLGAFAAKSVIAVVEVKGSFGSFEEMHRSLDAKVRLAPSVAGDRFGWTPSLVGRLLVVPEDSTIRRLVATHAATMGSAYPARSREVRAWLRQPSYPIRGLWFLSELQQTTGASG